MSSLATDLAVYVEIYFRERSDYLTKSLTPPIFRSHQGRLRKRKGAGEADF